MELELQNVLMAGEDDADGARAIEMQTDSGVIHARYHEAKSGDAAVIWVFGSGGGLNGPAGGMYTRLAKQLTQEGITSLRVDYRRPGDLVSSVLDVFAAIYYLESIGCPRIALVGHSFGGSVVICAGSVNPRVAGVAALSSQLTETDPLAELAGRPLLLMHGTRDEVLPHSCSEDILRRAGEPKEMRLYDCTHGLDDCSAEIDADLTDWIRRTLPGSPVAAE
jgi:alpha/beta superfamily hydrolase